MSTITQEVDHDSLTHAESIEHLLEMCDRLRQAIIFLPKQEVSQGYEWIDDALLCLAKDISDEDYFEFKKPISIKLEPNQIRALYNSLVKDDQDGISTT